MGEASRLVVDTAYQGNHGIGRYAAEVVRRLDPGWRPLAEGRTSRWVARAALASGAVLYSPGFRAGPSKARQVLTIHDLTHVRRPERGRGVINDSYYRLVVRRAIRRAGHVITVSETSARDIDEWIDDPHVQVHNARNGCSPAFTVDGPRADLSRPYLLFVGNFKSHKNPALAFQAASAMTDHLLVVVSTDVTAAAAMAKAYGVADRMRVRTDIDDEGLAALYRGADVLVFPSVWEGFGLPVLEAMSCGTKVVYCSSARAVDELCEGTQFAVSDPTDGDECVARIEQALSAGFAAPASLDAYSWDSVAVRVREVLRAVRGADHE